MVKPHIPCNPWAKAPLQWGLCRCGPCLSPAALIKVLNWPESAKIEKNYVELWYRFIENCWKFKKQHLPFQIKIPQPSICINTTKSFWSVNLALNLWTAHPACSELCKLNNNNKNQKELGSHDSLEVLASCSHVIEPSIIRLVLRLWWCIALMHR